MMTEKKIDKRQVRQHFSSHADEYDRYAKVQQTVARRLATLVEPYLRAGQRGLEVGCGTGLLSQLLLQCQTAPQLILSDLAHGMSQHVNKTLPECPVCDADAAALPFRADSFDLVVSSSVYQWLNDLPNAFCEIDQVLNHNGTVAIALFGEKTLYELRSSHCAALAGKTSHVQTFPSLAAVSAALDGRFRILTLRSEFEIEWHADVRSLLRSLKKIGAQNASQQRPQGLASRKTMQKMMSHYEERFRTLQGIPATYEVIYLLAQRY